MEKKYQVFVSSTYLDLIDERNEVMKALLELDCIPSGMELFPSSDDSQWVYIKKVIDNCDYFISITAGKYGSIAKNGKSYTQIEYEYALSKNIPTIAFLYQDLGKLLLEKSETDIDKKNKLLEFRKSLEKKLCRYWNNKNDLSALVSRSISKIIKDKPAKGWIKASLTNTDNEQLQFDSILSQFVELKQILKVNKLEKNYDHLPKIRAEHRLNEDKKVELGVVGLSVSQTQKGAYALIFDNNLNNKRIPIIIGPVEAQAIAIQLEKIQPPRPLTHDIIKSIIEAIGFVVKEVLIDYYDEGDIFYSILILSDGLNEIEIDVRTSDAIALALRCNTPFYTYLDILDSIGMEVDDEE